MDLRQHPSIHFMQIRNKTKGIHYPVIIILHSGPEITMADTRIINGLTKATRVDIDPLCRKIFDTALAMQNQSGLTQYI